MPIDSHLHYFCLKANFWTKWKCLSIRMFYHISLEVNPFNQSAVRLGRSLAFFAKDSTTMIRVVFLLQLYVSLVRSHLNHVSTIWSLYNLSRNKVDATWLLDYGIADTKISWDLLTIHKLCYFHYFHCNCFPQSSCTT